MVATHCFYELCCRDGVVLRHWSRPDVSFQAEILCILSFVSKTILTWQLYFGAFSRAQNDLVAFDPRNVTNSC